jgi:DNA-binding transcriptional LysR family regulator
MFSNASQLRSLDWDRLRIFIAVVRSGGLSKAVEVLNITQSAISRQVAALEQDIGSQLFIRNPKGLTLTHKGKLLFEIASEVYDELVQVQQSLFKSNREPKGKLNVSTPLSLGGEWLVPNLKEFLFLYPDMTVSILFQEEEADLSKREADVAIQPMPSSYGDTVQELLFSTHLKLYASKEYLKECGTPTKVDHLDYHRLIAYDDSTNERYSAPFNWLLHLGRESSKARVPYLSIHGFMGIKVAIEEGVGIGALFQKPSDELNPNLVNVLPDVLGPKLDIYFVYPEILKGSEKIIVFGQYLSAHFSHPPLDSKTV